MLVLSPIVNLLGHAPDRIETDRIHLLEIGAGALSSLTGMLV